MSDLSKSEKRLLGELLAEAHEAELARALTVVEVAFREWRNGAILPSEVDRRIHEHHKESQEIFKVYNYSEPLFALARAIHLELIREEQVPEPLRNRVLPLQDLLLK
jgi:hypothetical protein